MKKSASKLPEAVRYGIFVQNIGLMLGQVILIFVSREAGLAILAVSGLFGIPLCLHHKLWDSLAMTTFFFVIDLAGIFIR